MQYDLHSHSTASDGTLTPSQLVRHAKAQNVSVLALTDHDITAGLEEAASEAEQLGVFFIPGIEISVSWQHQTVHIVGLGIEPGFEGLQTGLSQLRAFREWRAEEIARRLEKAGIQGAYAGAKHYAGGRIFSRTHFARFLVEAGHARSVQDVFKKFLVRNKPGYVPGQWATLEQALSWIHGAGGIAVIAHPARYKLTASRLRRLLGEFKEYGGAGLEVVSGSHSKDESRYMAQLSQQFELLASCGSDYHGPENPYIELGQLPSLPEQCCPIWSHPSWPVSE